MSPIACVGNSLINYLQSKSIHCSELDGTVDENRDGQKDTPDGKTSAAEWAHFFGQAEQYTPATLLKVINLTSDERPSDQAAAKELASFYLSVIESRRSPEAVSEAANALSKLINTPGLDVQVKEYIVFQLLELIRSGKIRIEEEPLTVRGDNTDITKLYNLIASKDGSPPIDPVENTFYLANIFRAFISDPRARTETLEKFTAELFSILGSGAPNYIKEKILSLLVDIAISENGNRTTSTNESLSLMTAKNLFLLIRSGKPNQRELLRAVIKIINSNSVQVIVKEQIAAEALRLNIRGYASILSGIASDKRIPAALKAGIAQRMLRLMREWPSLNKDEKRDLLMALYAFMLDAQISDDTKEEIALRTLALLSLNEMGSPDSPWGRNITRILEEGLNNPKISINTKKEISNALLNAIENGFTILYETYGLTKIMSAALDGSIIGRSSEPRPIATVYTAIFMNPDIDKDIKVMLLSRLLSIVESDNKRISSSAREYISGSLLFIASEPSITQEINETLLSFSIKMLSISNDIEILKTARRILVSLLTTTADSGPAGTINVAFKNRIFNMLEKMLRESANIDCLNNVMFTLSAMLAENIPAEIRGKISNLLLDLLNNSSSFAFSRSTSITIGHQNTLRGAAAYAIIKTLIKAPKEKQEEIVARLLRIIEENPYSEIGKFLSSLLISNKAGLSISVELQKRIGRLVDRLLPAAPPYESWFRPGKTTLTIKIYFQESDKFGIWEHRYLNPQNGFTRSVRMNNGVKEFVFERTVGRTKIIIIVPEPPRDPLDFKAQVFESMADPNIDWIVYNGHSGMGAELAMSLGSAQRPEGAEHLAIRYPKLIQSASCFSVPYYMGKVRDLYPNSQFIGTLEGADSRDGCTIFRATLEGILARRTWKEIGSVISSDKHFVMVGGKPNCLLPNQPEQLSYLDSDGDGLRDNVDTVYNLGSNSNIISRDTFTFDPLSTVPQPGKALQVLQDVSISFSWNDTLRYFGRYIRIPADGEFEIKGWFRHRRDGTDFLRITETEDPNGLAIDGTKIMFDIEMNVGYALCSETVLKMMMIIELNKYFSENFTIMNGRISRKATRSEITPEEMTRGFLLAVEVLEKLYKAADNPEQKQSILRLYDDYLRSLGLTTDHNNPRYISFNMVLDALSADDGAHATRTAQASILEIRNRLKQA